MDPLGILLIVAILATLFFAAVYIKKHTTDNRQAPNIFSPLRGHRIVVSVATPENLHNETTETLVLHIYTQLRHIIKQGWIRYSPAEEARIRRGEYGGIPIGALIVIGTFSEVIGADPRLGLVLLNQDKCEISSGYAYCVGDDLEKGVIDALADLAKNIA